MRILIALAIVLVIATISNAQDCANGQCKLRSALAPVVAPVAHAVVNLVTPPYPALAHAMSGCTCTNCTCGTHSVPTVTTRTRIVHRHRLLHR